MNFSRSVNLLNSVWMASLDFIIGNILQKYESSEIDYKSNNLILILLTFIKVSLFLISKASYSLFVEKLDFEVSYIFIK